jgi:hypothetical protein
MSPDNEMVQRMVRVETKLDILITQIDKLPPSPVCIDKHKELDRRLDSIERWQNRLAGVFLALNLLFILAIEKIKAFFFGASTQ